MRLCSWSDRRRPSAWMTLWRWSWVSAPLPLPLAARDPLSLVRSSLISGFYSLPLTRVLAPLSSRRARARQKIRRPAGRRPLRAADAIRVPGRQLREQLAVAGLAQLLADGADRGLDHRVAIAPAHQVRAHRVVVLGRRLDQHDTDALRAQLLGLAAEAPPAEAACRGGDPLGGVPRERWVERARRVEADDEVERLVAQDVEVRGRPEAAVDVAPSTDRDRVVEARDGARRGHGVGEVGVRRVLAAEGDAAAGGVVTRDYPEVRVVGPAGGHDAADRVLQRVRRDEAARQPAGEERGGAVLHRRAQAAGDQLPRPGADRRRPLVEAEARAGGAVGGRRRSAVGAP